MAAGIGFLLETSNRSDNSVRNQQIHQKANSGERGGREARRKAKYTRSPMETSVCTRLNRYF
jgi:hypothetical protein